MRTNMNYIRRYFYRKKRDRAEMAENDDGDGNSHNLTVDELSGKPHRAWAKRKHYCKVEKMKAMDVSSPISENSLRFVCVGDTHVRLEQKGGDISDIIPPGDVLLHAGDFSMYGTKEEISLFNDGFGSLPHKVKILIAGNHDQTLDVSSGSSEEAEEHRKLLTNFLYLEDAMLEFCGIKLYGSPWVPVCGNWGFTLQRGAPLLRRWNMIPDNVDILMTHGPPLGYGDTVYDGYKVGCVDLLNTIRDRVRPKYHVYGHIHEGYGMRTDGHTVFINAAICTKWYRPLNPPIVFDYPLPPGHSKDELDGLLTSLEHCVVNVKDDGKMECQGVHKASDFMNYVGDYVEVEEELTEEEKAAVEVNSDDDDDSDDEGIVFLDCVG